MISKILKNKKILFSLVALVAVGAVLIVTIPTSSAQEEVKQYYRTQELQKEVLEELISGTGTVQASESATVSATVANIKIVEVKVSTGDYVTQGDTMFVLDTTDLYESIAEKEEDIQILSDSLNDTFDKAKEKTQSAYDVVYSTGGTLEVYNTALANFEKVKTSIAYLQTAYDEAYAKNQEAAIKVNTEYSAYLQAQNAIAVPTMPIAPDPADSDYTALLAQYNIDLDNYNNVLLPDYNAALAAVSKTAYDDAVAQQAITLSDLQAKETELKNAKTSLNYEDYEDAYNAAKQSYDTTLSNYNTALEQQVEADDARYDNTNLETMRDQYDDLVNSIDDYYITAEITGQVTEVNADVGTMTSQSATLAKIQDTNSLEIEISITESKINQIELGQEAIIEADATQNSAIEIMGVVSEISPTATQEGAGSSSSNFTVKVDVLTEVSDLLVGMNAQANIIVKTTQSEYLIPLTAIETVQGVSSIYVQTGEASENLQDENYEKIQVELLENDGYYTQISSNQLKDGMIVVTNLELQSEIVPDISEEAEGLMDMMPMGGGQAPSGMGQGGRQ